MAWSQYDGAVYATGSFASCYSNVLAPPVNSFQCTVVDVQTYHGYFDGTPRVIGCDQGVTEWCFYTAEIGATYEAVTGLASAVGVPASSAPFDFTAAQQADIYTAMGSVFGLLLAGAAAIWGIKQLIRLFGWHGNQDE